MRFILGEHKAFLLPPNPTLHLFVYDPASIDPGKEVRVSSASGKPLPAEWTQVESRKATSTMGAPEQVAVYQLRIDSGTEREVVVAVPGERPSTFRIDARWSAPSLAPLRITDDRVSHGATCPSELTRDLGVSGRSGAFIVEWAASEADFRAGRRERRWVPFGLPVLGDWSDAGVLADPNGRLQLGEPACLGPNFTWPRMQPVWMGVIAVYPDGSRSVSPTEPYKLSPPE